MYENQNEIFVTSEEVSKALDAKSPIIALESTIITHGLPFPDNWELAIKAEDTVRSYGCTPATIAVINGKVKIGNGSWVGIGASLIQNIKIGSNVLIGAGSVVISNIDDESKAVGVPAKVL